MSNFESLPSLTDNAIVDAELKQAFRDGNKEMGVMGAQMVAAMVKALAEPEPTKPPTRVMCVQDEYYDHIKSKLEGRKRVYKTNDRKFYKIKENGNDIIKLFDEEHPHGIEVQPTRKYAEMMKTEECSSTTPKGYLFQKCLALGLNSTTSHWLAEMGGKSQPCSGAALTLLMFLHNTKAHFHYDPEIAMMIGFPKDIPIEIKRERSKVIDGLVEVLKALFEEREDEETEEDPK